MPSSALPRRAVSRLRRVARQLARRLRRTPSQEHPASIRRARLAEVAARLRAQPLADGPRRAGLTLATAVGERLAAELGAEVPLLPLAPDGVLPSPTPDLLLVELAYGELPGWSADPAELLELLGAAAAREVPSVVWVTADSSDELPGWVGDLLAVAAHVVVAEPDALPAWRARSGQTPVHELLPAIHPRLHRPGAPGQARPQATVVLLDPPSSGGAGLATDPLLADADLPWGLVRMLDVWPTTVDGRTRRVPERLQGRLAEPLSPADAAGLPGEYPVLVDAGGADVRSGWTALAAGAAQTAVVAMADRARQLPGDIREHVCAVEEFGELAGAVNVRINQSELRDREGLQLHRAVLAGHTMRHRVDQLLTLTGAPLTPARRSVSAVVPTNRLHEIDNVLANVGRQQHDDLQLVLVLHGVDVDEPGLRGRAVDAGVSDLVLLRAEPSLTLGACMNLGLDAADGRYIAKMDDDNHYGPHYLGDLLSAFDYTDAQIVGKWAHYVWLRASGAVVLRHAAAEHTYERRIQGGSMLFDGDLVRQVRFSDIPRAVDSDILDRARADGAKVYSADRFNYVSIRGADHRAHTWTVADHTFMTATGRLTFFGDPREHVDV